MLLPIAIKVRRKENKNRAIPDLYNGIIKFAITVIPYKTPLGFINCKNTPATKELVLELALLGLFLSIG